MGKWKKSSPELVEAFDSALGEFPDAERRQMFGYPCAFVNNNMVTGLHEENWILRLHPEDRQQLLDAGGSEFGPMGPVMREYAALPAEMIADTAKRKEWIERSFDFTRAMPPKKKKAKKKRAT